MKRDCPPSTVLSIDGQHAWLSAHLFVGSDNHQGTLDRVLANVVGPFVRESFSAQRLRQFFFIRYGELGRHIRLRLSGEAPTLLNEVAPSFIEHVHATFDAELIASPRGELPPNSASSTHPAVYWIPYVPEVDRYGGSDAVRVAESLFHDSSRFVLSVLPAITAGSQSNRIGIGLAAIGILVKAFGNDVIGMRRLTDGYARWARSLAGGNWDESITNSDAEAKATSQLQSLWSGLSGDRAPEALQRYYDDCQKRAADLAELQTRGRVLVERTVAPWETAKSRLVSSYLHMTTNRLGINNYEEGRLAGLAAICSGNVPGCAFPVTEEVITM